MICRVISKVALSHKNKTNLNCRLNGHVTDREVKINIYKISASKPEGKSLQRLRSRWNKVLKCILRTERVKTSTRFICLMTDYCFRLSIMRQCIFRFHKRLRIILPA